MKVVVNTTGRINLLEKFTRLSCLMENITSSSDGERLETDRKVPRQSFTRQLFFKCIKQNLKIKRFWGKNENAVRLQIITAMIAYVLLRIAQIKNQSLMSIQQVRTIIRIKLHDQITIYKALKIPDRPKIKQIRGFL